MSTPQTLRFCGEPVSRQDLSLILEVCETYKNPSQTEIASTICELLEWCRPNGRPKTIECYQFLNNLQEYNEIRLPDLRQGRPAGVKTWVEQTRDTDCQPSLQKSLSEVQPVKIVLVENASKRRLWKEFIDRYHYLGFRTPFGAQLRYLIVCQNQSQILGCLQFSSPAWKLKARDAWIGWTDTQRKNRLQLIVQNSRFLILPWIKIKSLASHVLSLASRQVVHDWKNQYGIRPVLLETFVENQRFEGTCYRAANWVHLGRTRGRGRNDRQNEHKAGIKNIWVRPLIKNWKSRLLPDMEATNRTRKSSGRI